MINEVMWKFGENLAKEYLIKNGYKVLYTNFTCVGVELDIVSALPKIIQKKKLKKELVEKIKQNNYNKSSIKILKKAYRNNVKNIEKTLVITEVKARANSNYGLGVEAVDNKKIKNIKKGANFLLSQKQFKNYQIRFDIASIDDGNITYIENAF